MKRMIFILLLAAFLVLTSCAQARDYGILEYQDKSIEAECLINGEFLCILKKDKEEISLKILEPSALSEISFVRRADELYAQSGDIKIPVKKEQIDGIYAVISLFDLKEEELTGATDEDGAAVLSFLNDQGKYVLRIGKNNALQSAQITGDGYRYEILFQGVKIQ